MTIRHDYLVDFPQRLSYHTYKIQTAQHLTDQDKIIDSNLCRHYMKVSDNDTDVLKVFMTFHLNKYADKPKLCFWAKENCLQLHEQPVHNSKVTFWCQMSVSTVIIPYLFKRTIDYYS
jgi:hypothetical protein